MSAENNLHIPTADEVAAKVVEVLAAKGLVVPGKALDKHEAAAYLGVSTKTLRGLVEHGKIKCGNATLGTGESANLVFSIYNLDRFARGE